MDDDEQHIVLMATNILMVVYFVNEHVFVYEDLKSGLLCYYYYFGEGINNSF